MLKYLGSIRERVLISVFIGLIVTGILMQYVSDAKEDITGGVVRLHVIANSDSEEDQRLKLAVRDAVAGYLGDRLKDAESVEETKDVIRDELQNIADTARAEIGRNGYDCRVAAYLGRFDFPTKHYEDVRLPAGRYDALRIVIGAGEGENWWCVLFPQLCFTSGSGGALSDAAKSKLKNVLTEDEMKIVTENDGKNIPVKIKFRLLELFNTNSH